MSVTEPQAFGCPSGLAPPLDEGQNVDARLFVRQEDDLSVLELSVSGAKCAGCISKIEGGLRAWPEVRDVRLNLSTGKLRVAWNGALDARAITQHINSLGYGSVPFNPAETDDADAAEGQKLLRAMAVAGFASANIMLLSVSVWAAVGEEMGAATRNLLHLVSALIALPAASFAARPFASSAFKALRRGGANMDVPITLAVLLALGVSLFEALTGGEHAYFDAAVMLLFFLLVGRWLDHNLRRRARSAARDLLALQSVSALRERSDGAVESVSASDVAVGDCLVLQPGRRLPVNGVVRSGRSDVDVAHLTGEAEPHCVDVGSTVYAGTRNISRTLKVEATSDASSSLVADLVRLVEAGQQAKDRYTVLADKAARLYVPVVHSLAAATFLGWIIAGSGPREAILAATAVLIITCPCALGLATPAVQVVATGQLFRRGVLVKSGNALERLAKIRHVVFDKTGTLTMGRLSWASGGALSVDNREKLGALARSGLHPLCRAVAAELGSGPLADNVREHPGLGIEGTARGARLRLGRAEFVGAQEQIGAAPGPTAWFRVNDEKPQLLLFEDLMRPDSAEGIAALRRAGISVRMLSGDRATSVAKTAAALGVENWYAENSPTDKAAMITDLRAEGPVAMVGDGINDAAALSLADVSFSPQSAADAAQSASDFVIVRGDVAPVYETWRMAVRSRRAILQNFAFAALYNAVAAPLAMAGLVTPLIAALAMSGSSLVVTLNAMRLMQKERR